MPQRVGVRARRVFRVRLAAAHSDQWEAVRVQEASCWSSVARSALWRCAACRSAHGATHHVEHLFNGFLGVALFGRIFHATANVVFEDQEAERVDGRAQCCRLLQDVDAVLLTVDHARDAAHLSLKSPQAIEQDLAVFCVAMPDMFCHTP